VLLHTDTVATKESRLDSPGSESPAASLKRGLETSARGVLASRFLTSCSHLGLEEDLAGCGGTRSEARTWTAHTSAHT